jgi:hypothetical protein
MRRVLLLILVSVVVCSGCSVYMASKQPGKKDLSVLKEGTHRACVIAELGSPLHSEQISDGRMDIYKFIQGYDKGARVSRAVFHGVADVLTLGIWEVVGTPIEAIADGTEVTLEVNYDKDDRVKTVKTISGGKSIGPTDKEETTEANKSVQ